MDILLVIVGLVLLLGAGDALVRGAVALSLRLGVPAIIVSATVVAFGTSAPELLISIQAAVEGAAGLALGNVVGSNIANVLLVLGIPAIITPLAGCGPDAQRNMWIMCGATAVFTALAMTGVIYWWGGLLLIAITVAMVADSISQGLSARTANEAPAEGDDLADLEDVDPNMATWKLSALMAAGLIGLPIGAQCLIDGARGIASDFGVSEALIGLSVVAIGTSLPELATTVMAALRQHADVAIGNVIGSNLFNFTAIIGAAALFAPLEVPEELLRRDLWVAVGATVLLIPYVIWCRVICRITGCVYLGLYATYLWVAFTA
ncbi:MAG: calcium/sodium antiporter [Pseudomonadota bacterium]